MWIKKIQTLSVRKSFQRHTELCDFIAFVCVWVLNFSFRVEYSQLVNWLYFSCPVLRGNSEFTDRLYFRLSTEYSQRTDKLYSTTQKLKLRTQTQRLCWLELYFFAFFYLEHGLYMVRTFITECRYRQYRSETKNIKFFWYNVCFIIKKNGNSQNILRKIHFQIDSY